MKFTTLVLLSGLPMFASDAIVPTADSIVAQMMERDNQRLSALHGFTAMRRYTLDNKGRHAAMLVRSTGLADGSKQFEIVEESGSGSVRTHVFHKMLEEEAAASKPNLRERSRLTPANYSFRLAGVEGVNGRMAYVLEVTPKSDSKYLIAGKIWVDAEDFAVVRVDGKPAKNPSFWTKSVHFVHSYDKNGMFWFPVSNRSVTDARIFGRADLTIEYFDYVPSMMTASAAVRQQ